LPPQSSVKVLTLRGEQVEDFGAESTYFDNYFVDQTSADTLAPALGNYINGRQLAVSTLGKALGSRHGLFAV
jgi:hypothetical protein